MVRAAPKTMMKGQDYIKEGQVWFITQQQNLSCIIYVQQRAKDLCFNLFKDYNRQLTYKSSSAVNSPIYRHRTTDWVQPSRPRNYANTKNMLAIRITILHNYHPKLVMLNILERGVYVYAFILNTINIV